MQSDFPFGHFCDDNNRLTIENVKHIVFSQGGENVLWVGVLNEIT